MRTLYELSYDYNRVLFLGIGLTKASSLGVRSCAFLVEPGLQVLDALRSGCHDPGLSKSLEIGGLPESGYLWWGGPENKDCFILGVYWVP